MLQMIYMHITFFSNTFAISLKEVLNYSNMNHLFYELGHVCTKFGSFSYYVFYPEIKNMGNVDLFAGIPIDQSA